MKVPFRVIFFGCSTSLGTEAAALTWRTTQIIMRVSGLPDDAVSVHSSTRCVAIKLSTMALKIRMAQARRAFIFSVGSREDLLRA